MDAKAGTRLRCGACGSELIVIKAGEPELSCCGKPLEPMASAGPAPPGL